MDIILFLIEKIQSFFEKVSPEILIFLVCALFWYRRYFALKQAEAFFGFYSRLSILLDCMCEWLGARELLQTSQPERGNIYSFMYSDTARSKICSGLQNLYPKDLDHLRRLAEKIEDALLQSDNNVYPRNAKKEKWYRSQRVIFKFCVFLHGGDFGTFSDTSEEATKRKDISRCEELVSAISFILESIKKQKY